MKIYLDSANIKELQYFNKTLKIDGVTTNPSIICKEDANCLDDVLNPIIKELNDNQLLFVEVISHDTKGIVEEAKAITKIRKNTVPKIPVTIEGLEAIKILANEHIDVLATAIMDATQVLLAAHNGAKYVAPYYNRMSTYDDGYHTICLMQNLLDNYKYDCEIVGAGYHNIKQVEESLSAGVKSITVTPDILRAMFTHEGTDNAVKKFEEIWFNKFSKNKLF